MKSGQGNPISYCCSVLRHPNRFMRLLARTVFVSICLNLVVSVGNAGQITDEELADQFRYESTHIRVENLQVSQLLRAIGRKSGVNVIVSEEIKNTISLDLADITLYDLFHLVLETKGLRYYQSNKALVIEREEDFKKEQRDVMTVRLCPGYGNPEGHLQELETQKSEDGTIALTSDGNCLVARDHEDNIRKIKSLLSDLDKPIHQVHIKAKIVSIAKATSRELGVKWGYTDLRNLPQDSLTGTVDLSVVNPTTNIVFGFIRDTFNLDLELSALQEKNKLHLLSEPRILVLDGMEAEIKQGKEIPYDSGTLENRSTSFREAVLSLRVVPKILRNGFIKLDVKVTNDSVDEDSTEDGQPLLDRQEIKTNLFLEDGVTVVIGGILAKGSDSTNEEVPWLADIPFVGNLFKKTDDVDKTYELLVFLTPTILKGPEGFSFTSETAALVDKETDVSNVSNSGPGKRMMIHPIEIRDTL